MVKKADRLLKPVNSPFVTEKLNFIQELAERNKDFFRAMQKHPALTIVSRDEWGAQPPTREPDYTETPAQNVVWTYRTQPALYCFYRHQCIPVVQKIQQNHFRRGMSDIAYNFLIGGDGTVYEGRGWGVESSTFLRNPHRHGKVLKEPRLDLAYIGDYRPDKITNLMIKNAIYLVHIGSKKNYIVRHWDVKEIVLPLNKREKIEKRENRTRIENMKRLEIPVTKMPKKKKKKKGKISDDESFSSERENKKKKKKKVKSKRIDKGKSNEFKEERYLSSDEEIRSKKQKKLKAKNKDEEQWESFDEQNLFPFDEEKADKKQKKLKLTSKNKEKWEQSNDDSMLSVDKKGKEKKTLKSKKKGEEQWERFDGKDWLPFDKDDDGKKQKKTKLIRKNEEKWENFDEDSSMLSFDHKGKEKKKLKSRKKDEEQWERFDGKDWLPFDKDDDGKKQKNLKSKNKNEEKLNKFDEGSISSDDEELLRNKNRNIKSLKENKERWDTYYRQNIFPFAHVNMVKNRKKPMSKTRNQEKVAKSYENIVLSSDEDSRI